MSLDRRELLALAAGLTVFPRFAGAQTEKEQDDPHFLFQIVMTGGLDPTYLFDARPSSFLSAKKHAYYLKEEAAPLSFEGGASTLATSLVNPLKPFLDRFSVVNGVVMMPAFDGHENNVGFLMTGDAFGGDTLLPHLNTGKRALPLDYVQMGGGTLLTTISNSGNAVPLAPDQANALALRLKSMPSFNDPSPLKTFAVNRMEIAGRGAGTFSAGARAMREGFGRMPLLAEALRTIEPPAADAETPDPDGLEGILASTRLVGELFRRRVARSGLFVFNTDLNPDQNLDTHDVNDAKKLPDILPKLMSELAAIFAYFRDTPFDDKRSLLDVTTICFGSEFGRTLRQTFPEFEKSGTDHNPLTNTAILGGKGIRGGRLIGSTDFATPDEVVSAAHLANDPKQIKIMGRPFDFATGTSLIDVRPEIYREEDYLTYSSVANTLYEAFGIGASQHRVLRRNGPKAPVLRGLLA